MCKNEGKHLELNGAQWEQILMNLIDKSVNGINSHLRRNLASISNCIHKLSLEFCRETFKLHRARFKQCNGSCREQDPFPLGFVRVTSLSLRTLENETVGCHQINPIH